MPRASFVSRAHSVRQRVRWRHYYGRSDVRFQATPAFFVVAEAVRPASDLRDGCKREHHAPSFDVRGENRGSGLSACQVNEGIGVDDDELLTNVVS
jgi:hypothetical protein